MSYPVRVASLSLLSPPSSRAVPRSALDALGILVLHSLTLFSLPRIDIWRERVEGACTAIQMVPSFLRVGSFKTLNPPVTILHRRTLAATPLGRSLRIRQMGQEGSSNAERCRVKRREWDRLEKKVDPRDGGEEREDDCWLASVRDCSRHAFGGRGLICTLGMVSRMWPTQASEFLARATGLDLTHSHCMDTQLTTECGRGIRGEGC